MTDVLIANATLVNEGVEDEGDVLLRNGRIHRIAPGIAATDATRVVDARGLHLMPGMIDDQVHFRDPGLTHKGDMATESRAALAGGITSFMDMPNTRPQTVTVAALEEKFQYAAGHCWGNYAFYMGTTNDNLEEIKRLKPHQTCGIKIFMGASTGNMLVDDPAVLESVFRDAPLRIVTHCEDTPTILANEARYREEYGQDVPMRFHPLIRSAEACDKSSTMAVDLAKRTGARLHILHLTTARELRHFSGVDLSEKRITAEACVHHLFFDDGDYAEKGSLIKCNPAIKTAEDRAALRQALADGLLDVIGTDHAPHTLEEKAGTYFKAPAGLPLVQHALPMALELYHDGVLTLTQVVEKCAHAPARLFGVRERGFLREGYWGDLVLVDLDSPGVVERDQVIYKCGWSPLEGRTLRSRVAATFVNGEPAFRGGVFEGSARGMRLEFA